MHAISHFLHNLEYSELMWNAFDLAFAEVDGELREIKSPFGSPAEYLQFITDLRAYAAVTTDFEFDGALPGGARVHVTYPPLSPHGPTVTIRKFLPGHQDLEGLLTAGTLSENAFEFLRASVRAKMNIVISGATGAGKTTLLGALAGSAPASERIITIEDTPELRLTHRNWVRLIAGRNPDALRACLVGTLRMRPDRIVVGECRSAETLEMLQMMNTGHDGGLTTLHANSPGDALTRLESLILFHAHAEIPLSALRRQITDAIDLVVHVRRSGHGQRQVAEIMEVVGLEGDVITRATLFKRAGPDQRLRLTGLVPSFARELDLPRDFFSREGLSVRAGRAS